CRTRTPHPVGAGNSNSALAGRLQPDRVIGRSVRSMAVAGRSRGVVVCFVYSSLRRLLELVLLGRRSEREKEIEILLLRQQLRVLQRQVARPEPTQADRMVLAAFSRVLPRQVWRRSAFVRPATLLRWHREL